MDRVLRPRNKRKDPSHDEEAQTKETIVEKKLNKTQSGSSNRRGAAQKNSPAQENKGKIKTKHHTTIVHTYYYARNVSEEVVINLLNQFQLTTNFMDDQGLSHFHVACMVGHIKMVETMLKGGVTLEPVSALDPVNKCKDNSALHFAVEYLQVEVVKLLLKFKADVNAKNSKGRTPLHVACSIKNKYCKVLVEHYRRDPKAKAFLDTEPEIQIIELLLKHKANKEERDIYDNTPILRSFTYSYYDLLDYCEILDKSVTPDKSYSLVLDKVQLMAKRHQLRKMELLVYKGADPSATNIYGNNILHLIIVNLHHQRLPAYLSQLSFKDGINVEAIKFILATRKVNVNTKNYKGDTPLALAVSYLSFQIVKVLLRYHAKVNTIKFYFSRHGSLYFRYANTLANYDAVGNLLDITNAIQKNGRYLELVDNIPILLFLEGVREPDTCIQSALSNKFRKANDFLIHATGKKITKSLAGRRSGEFIESLISLTRAISAGNIHFEPELSLWLLEAKMLDEAQALTNDYKRYEYEHERRALAAEVKILETILIDDKSLLELLRSKPKEIHMFIYLKRKQGLLNLNKYNTILNRYRKLIEAHFTKALIWHYYVRVAKDFFCVMTEVSFPWICVDRIFDYLEQEDLKNLCLSVMRLNVTYRETFYNSVYDLYN